MPKALAVGYPVQPLPADVRPPWMPGEPFDQTDAQRSLHLSTAQLVIVSAGYRAGKTRGLVMEAIFLALENLGCVVLLVSPNYPLSRDIIEPEMEQALEACGLVEGEHWTFAKSSRTYKLFGGRSRGGADIRLRSAEKPQRIVGTTVAAALLDEPALMDEAAYKFVRRRVSDPRAKRRVVVLAGTPDPGTWFARMVGNPPDGADVIFASTDGNPWIDRQYLDELAQDYDAKALEAYRSGRPVSMTGGAYHAFSGEVWPAGNVGPCAYNPTAPLYVALDNNRDPLVAVLAQRVGNILEIVGEIFIRGGSWSALAEHLHAKLGGAAPAGIILHGDPVLRGAIDNEATDWGAFESVKQQVRRVFGQDVRVAMRAKKGHPLELNRLETVNAHLCNAKGERRVKVSPSCVELIADLREVDVDENGQLRKPGRSRGVAKERTHLCFAAGTMVMTPSGPVPVEALPRDGMVTTWDGSPAAYVDAGMTQCAVEIVSVNISDGSTVQCTPWHQWLTTDGWLPAIMLTGRTLADWRRPLSALPDRTSSGSSTTATTAGTSGRRATEASNTFTGSCGLITTGQSHPASPCTTSTTIARTTGPRISNSCHLVSTCATTCASGCRTVRSIRAAAWSWLARLRRAGTVATRAARGIVSMLRAWLDGWRSAPGSRSGASTAAASLSPGSPRRDSARETASATPGRLLERTMSRSSAPGAATRSAPTSTPHARSADVTARHVIAVERAGRADVYCLRVPSSGCFGLACGAVVSNSDALGYLLHAEWPVGGSTSPRRLSIVTAPIR